MCSKGYYNSFCHSNTTLEANFIIFASAIGQATLATFALGQHRFMGLIMMFQYFALVSAFFHGGPRTPGAAYCEYRNSPYNNLSRTRVPLTSPLPTPIDLSYHTFVQVISFFIERSNRQLFELGEQLRLQYKATQRAQVVEKKASDLTKRFVSYSERIAIPLINT